MPAKFNISVSIVIIGSTDKIKNRLIRRYSSFPHSNPHAYHSALVKNGSSRALHLVNYLLTLYLKTPHSDNARKLFDEIPHRDVKTWTILISGFCRHGHHVVALDYFTKMQSEGMTAPNAFTLSSVLKCCSSVGLPMGKAVHGWIIRNGVRADVALGNAVLDLYAKVGTFEYVKRYFEMMAGEKDSTSWNIAMAAVLSNGDMKESLDFFWRLPIKSVSSWNTIIDGLLHRGFERKALGLLGEMVKSGPAFDRVTFSISLVLASSIKSLDLGKQIHGHLLRIGIDEDSFVTTALLDMYCKCREMGKASVIFREMQHRLSKEGSQDDLMAQTVSWSTMIAGYVQHGMIKDALVYFRFMMHERAEVDLFTLTTIVVASADTALLELGQQIHARTLKSGHMQDIFLCSSLIDMYAKCGKLDEAWSFFMQTRTRNIVLWSTMISSYGMHGWGKEAIQLFELMRNEGIRPNRVSFVGLLTACSHAGLVEDGCKYFKMMKGVYDIQPDVQHFACMVDLFGRACLLEEIKDFVYENGIHNIREVWKAYLSSCWLHKNVEMTNWVSGKLLELNPHEADSYLLASNTYSANNVWEEAAKCRGLMVERGVTKLPGQSWI